MIHIHPAWPNGAKAMLSETAPPELVFQIGAEAVVTVLWASGTLRSCGDEMWLERDYWLQHCAHGRVYKVAEKSLLRISDSEANGQTLLYREQLREAVALFGPAIRKVLQ